jgi:probable addiction module antidote protein
MHAALQDDAEAAAYLQAAIDERDAAGLMIALRRIAEARGGIATIAERTGLSRETLYRTLSERGNPRLSSLAAILNATGLKIAIAPA